MKKFIPFILVLGAFVAITFGYGFMYAQVSGGIARATRALSQVEALSERDALVRSQQIFLENASEDIAIVDGYVAGDDDVVVIIETVEETARAEGVSIAISTVHTTDGGWTDHEGIELRFSVSGSFAAMMRFIAALEAMPQASELNNVALENSSGANWFGSFSMIFVKKK